MTVQELITQINIESNEILDEPTEYTLSASLTAYFKPMTGNRWKKYFIAPRKVILTRSTMLFHFLNSFIVTLSSWYRSWLRKNR